MTLIKMDKVDEEIILAEYQGDLVAAICRVQPDVTRRQAAVIASELRSRPHFQRKLNALRNKLCELESVNVIDILTFWFEVMHDESEQTKNRLKASQFLAKFAGLPGFSTEVAPPTGGVNIYMHLGADNDETETIDSVQAEVVGRQIALSESRVEDALDSGDST